MLLESGVYEGFAEEAPQFRFDQLFVNARYVRLIRLPDAMDVHATTTRYVSGCGCVLRGSALTVRACVCVCVQLGEIRRARSLYKRRMRPDKQAVKRPTAARASSS